MDLQKLSQEAFETAKAHDWHDMERPDETHLMLIITEIAEAVQADRKGLRADRERYDYAVDRGMYNDMEECFERYIKNSVEDELADIVIRLLDFCGMKGYSFDHRLALPEEYFMCDFIDFTWYLCWNILCRKVEIVVWSVIYYCNVHGIDILWHIERKMEYNKMRPRMHNAKY